MWGALRGSYRTYTAPVVKLHCVAGNGLPEASRIPAVSRTVYCVLAARVGVGLNVITLVVALYVTTPGITVPVAVVPNRTLTFAATMVPAAIASLNVAVTLAPRATLTAPLAGVLAVTDGAGPVRNAQLVVVSGLPALSLIAAAPPVSVTVYRVSTARLAFGLIVNTLVVAL